MFNIYYEVYCMTLVLKLTGFLINVKFVLDNLDFLKKFYDIPYFPVLKLRSHPSLREGRRIRKRSSTGWGAGVGVFQALSWYRGRKDP